MFGIFAAKGSPGSLLLGKRRSLQLTHSSSEVQGEEVHGLPCRTWFGDVAN